MLKVRRLAEGDAAAFRGIRLLTLATEPGYFGTLHEMEAARPLADFASVLARSHVFGAIRDGAVGGVVRWTREAGAKERHKGSLHGFFVRPDWRRGGVATALMRAVIADARQEVERLTLSVVAGNAAAITLYERFGFTAYGVEPQARKTAEGYQDIVLMALALVG